MVYKNIEVFDFDKTLIHTAEPEEGRKKWLAEKKENFPHPTGWWAKKESLDTDIFYPAINAYTYKLYLNAISKENTYTVLATGRIEKLREEVMKILNFHNFKFHDVFLCNGSSTFVFKTRLFESILRKNPKAETFTIYDDRHEHLVNFVEWAKDAQKKYKTTISIIDVINKKQLL